MTMVKKTPYLYPIGFQTKLKNRLKFDGFICIFSPHLENWIICSHVFTNCDFHMLHLKQYISSTM